MIIRNSAQLALTSLLTVVLFLPACGNDPEAIKKSAKLLVDHEQLVKAGEQTSQWLTYNQSYKAQRYSPNKNIKPGNINKLGLSWFADMDTKRGQEATPLVIDGKLYLTTAWSKVKAYDAKTGEFLWAYDPKVPPETAVKGCCDVVNRGLAAWADKLYLGTFDGRLIALDRATGKPVWEALTVDQDKSYTITGAPLVVNGKVIIGNGGAEFGVRGYISAYDAKSGEQLWRFYTVPDNPATGAQPEYLNQAAKTWTGQWWKLGGGGTVWDSMTYDPELDLLYIGVGNGSPWNQKYRSPEGGDNLYLSSIVAIKPDTGEYVWHYQTTPGETWDFTATQHIMLADLEIDGKLRKVLMQAPKNGFFYVLDRATGEFISAQNFVPVTWAKGIDPQTGRPIENPEARYYNSGKLTVVLPGPGGAHSWQPMAFNPEQGLVYIPANIGGFPFVHEKNWQAKPQGFNTGADFAAAAMPAIPAVRKAAAEATGGALIAWDPVLQQARWQVDYPAAANGGVLATAGGLVFQGTAAAELIAYDAASGKRVWSFPTQSSVLAAPISYVLDGEQYIAVLVGRGGIFALSPGYLALENAVSRNISRLLVFKLNADKALPKLIAEPVAALTPPVESATDKNIQSGSILFARYCGTCHGDAAISGGVLPDLRYSAMLHSSEVWQAVVHDGALASRGMVSWNKVLDPAEADDIRHYVIRRAHQDLALELAE